MGGEATGWFSAEAGCCLTYVFKGSLQLTLWEDWGRETVKRLLPWSWEDKGLDQDDHGQGSWVCDVPLLSLSSEGFIPSASGMPPPNSFWLSALFKNCLLWRELSCPMAFPLLRSTCIQWPVSEGCSGLTCCHHGSAQLLWAIWVQSSWGQLRPTVVTTSQSRPVPFSSAGIDPPAHLAHIRMSFHGNTCDIRWWVVVRFWIYFEGRTKWICWWTGGDVKKEKIQFWNTKIFVLNNWKDGITINWYKKDDVKSKFWGSGGKVGNVLGIKIKC